MGYIVDYFSSTVIGHRIILTLNEMRMLRVPSLSIPTRR